MRRFLLGFVFATAVVLGGMFTAGRASAISGCDDYAIMKCGATSPSEFITKVNQNTPGDLKAVYADYGLVPQEYARFANNAKQGTVYADGRIVVNGAVVGHSTQNVGRVHDANFNQRVTIDGHDYWGGSFGSTYHANSADVMVLFNDRGVMEFAVVSSCGNPQRFTANAPNYSCENLNKTRVSGTDNRYSFTTKASTAQGAEVVKAVYDFGDGDSRTVTDLSQDVEHTFTKDSKVRVTVYVRLPGGAVVTTTSPDCVAQVTFQPPAEETPNAKCVSLDAALIEQQQYTYRFTARAHFSNGTTFKGATFDFGDGTKMTGLQPNGSSVTSRHSYAKAGKYTMTATLFFTSPDSKSFTASCLVKITPTTITNYCAPGIPEGSAECAPPIVTTTTTTSTPAAATASLVNAGAGSVVGLFAGTGAIAGFGHYWFRRRQLG